MGRHNFVVPLCSGCCVQKALTTRRRWKWSANEIQSVEQAIESVCHLQSRTLSMQVEWWCLGGTGGGRPVAQPWRRPSPHGESRRGIAKPSPWRDFYDGDIVATATLIAIWRHPSPYGDRRRKGETAFNLITFCIQLVPMLSKRWQAGELKKTKVA